MSKTAKPMIPEHVFISFSQEDREAAESMVQTLCRNNIPAWIDYAKLVPGTQDWEAAIRDAIEKSFAVVVMASPDSRESRFVRGELNLAELRGCQVYPIWIDGTDWPDCIPLGMTYMQYIDARGKRRDQGIAELCKVLGQHIHNMTPKHYFVSPLRRLAGMGQNKSLIHLSPPLGFASVELTEGSEDSGEEGGNAVFIRVSDYSCVQEFLDDLYINYLSDRFHPFTYGSNWILQESGRLCSLILVSWSWLAGPHASSRLENHWLHDKPLEDCGLRPGTSWILRMTSDVKPTGLAINDERIFRAMRRSPKAEYFLRHNGFIADQSVDQVCGDYQFRFVISHEQCFGDDIEPGMAIVQSQNSLPEDFIKYWLRC